MNKQSKREMWVMFYNWMEAASPQMRKMARLYLDETVPKLEDKDKVKALKEIEQLMAKGR